MNLKEILNYTLIKSKDFEIEVYDILIVLSVLLLTKFLLVIVKKLFLKRINNKKIDKGTGNSIFQLLKYLVWFIAILVSLESVGVNLTILVASSAALLVGLGFGLQDIFRDIVSGIFLLFEGTVKVDDIVEIEEGIVGRVKEIGMRSSKIETRDNIIMIIPNSKFIQENVINWTLLEKKTRFRVTVGVAYGSDVGKVSQVLLQCSATHPKISDNPQAFVRFNDFGDSALEFQLYFWTSESFVVENIKSDLRFSIYKAFQEHQIAIPFPQQDIYIKQMPGNLPV